MIWFCLIIPFIITLLMIIKGNFKIYEYLYPILISSFLIFGIVKTAEHFQTSDYEYWGGWITQARDEKPWDELCTRIVTTTDSKGHSHSHTETYWVHHSEHWVANDSNIGSYSISPEHFEYLHNKFNNLHISRSLNPQTFLTQWKGEDIAFEPCTSIHTYENRVKSSDSIFRSKHVNKEDYGLFEYPKIEGFYNCRSVLGLFPNANVVDRELTILNAKYGASKQIRFFLTCFIDKPVAAAQEQEAYWCGGNKNEFNIVIGIDKETKLNWCYVFSWCENNEIKLITRNHIMEQVDKPVDLRGLDDWLKNNVIPKWSRKHFKDFNYINIEIPNGYIIFTIILLIGVNIFIPFILIQIRE